MTIAIEIVAGIVYGCQPIISYNMGAALYNRVKQLYAYINLITIAIGCSFTLCFQLAPQRIIGCFGIPTNIPNPQDYWLFAGKVFTIYLACVLLTCWVKTSAIFFQAAGHPLYALLAGVIRDIICFLPLVLLLPHYWGLDGILYAAPISDIIAFLVTILLSYLFLKHL